MTAPPEPIAGQPISARWGSQLLRYIRSITPQSSADVLVRRQAGGTTMAVRAVSGGGFAAPPRPFQLVDGSNSTDGPRIRIVYGTLNGQAPAGFSPGDVPPFYIVPLDSGYVYLEVTTDTDGNVTSVSVGNAGTIPDDSDGDYHFQIGSYAHTSGPNPVLQLSSVLAGSLAFELCGGATPLWGAV